MVLKFFIECGVFGKYADNSFLEAFK
jgi:hypothetical protein